MPHEDRSKPPRLHQLDGLRAVAALLVLAHHTLTPSIEQALTAHGLPWAGRLFASMTCSGVDLFFVLSGVVLLRPYVRRERDFEARTYFARRVERIWPPYLAAWIAAGAVVAWATARPSWFSLQVLPTFSWGTWLAQIGILRFSEVLYNSAWWSLQVELCFYFSIPLLLAPLSSERFDRRAATLWLGACAVASLVLPRWLPSQGQPLAVLYSLASYCACFYGGILIARFDVSPRAARALIWTGAVGVLVLGAALGGNVHLGYGLLYTGLVARAVAPRVRWSGALAQPLMVWLGERSYSLFLIHSTVFHFVYNEVARVLPDKGLAYVLLTRGVGIPAAFLAAMVLFQLVERRFARGLVTADQFWPPLGQLSSRAAVQTGIEESMRRQYAPEAAGR